MDATILQTPGDEAAAHALVIHDQVEREILDEELGVVLQALLIQRVQDRMPGAIGGGAGTHRRRSLTVFRHVAAERALIDSPLSVRLNGTPKCSSS